MLSEDWATPRELSSRRGPHRPNERRARAHDGTRRRRQDVSASHHRRRCVLPRRRPAGSRDAALRWFRWSRRRTALGGDRAPEPSRRRRKSLCLLPTSSCSTTTSRPTAPTLLQRLTPIGLAATSRSSFSRGTSARAGHEMTLSAPRPDFASKAVRVQALRESSWSFGRPMGRRSRSLIDDDPDVGRLLGAPCATTTRRSRSSASRRRDG